MMAEEKILFPLWLEEETLDRFQALARSQGLSTPVLMQRLLKQFAEEGRKGAREVLP